MWAYISATIAWHMNHRFAAVLILLGAVIVGYFGLQRTPAHTTQDDSMRWAGRIDRVGSPDAYKEFVREYTPTPFTTQHTAAHLMGILLYQKMGISGVAVCDASFAFGCYHGFFGRVIADKGVAVVPDLAENCRKQFGAQSTGCEHGIGHGIMEYTGRAKLMEGLELCKDTKQVNELYGCTSGLFMEYNSAMKFRDGVAYTDERLLDMKNPLAPCDSVPTPYRTSCYFEIGLWWKGQLGTDYEKIGNLCTKAGTQPERDACYRGWGTVVAESVDHDSAEAKKVCGLIHASFGTDTCLLGVASRFFPAGYPQAGQEICTALSGSLARECLSLAPQNAAL